MTANHTPGPWIVHDETVVWAVLHEPVENTYDLGNPIADVRRRSTFAREAYPESEVTANACLLAAAPEMLKALKACRVELSYCKAQLAGEGYESREGGSVCEALRLGDEAIAKAESTP
jgi:hypothetical protein